MFTYVNETNPNLHSLCRQGRQIKAAADFYSKKKDKTTITTTTTKKPKTQLQLNKEANAHISS